MAPNPNNPGNNSSANAGNTNSAGGEENYDLSPKHQIQTPIIEETASGMEERQKILCGYVDF